MHKSKGPFRLLSYLLLICSIIAACAITIGCSNPEHPLEVDLSKRSALPPIKEEQAITYAYLPQYSHIISYARHNALIDYLQRSTGLEIKQVFPKSFDEHIRMVRLGEIDISFSNPIVYLQVAETGAKAFARIVESNGLPDFRGQIISRADNSKINSLRDCIGKKWIAVDPSSAGGYIFPLGLFAEHGILPSDFTEISFASGSGAQQEKVVHAVYSGLYDIGTIREGTLNVMRSDIDINTIKVLAHTPAYPSWVYAARKGLNPQVVKKIANAMFALDKTSPETASILYHAKISGIIPATDKDYNPVRELMKRLGGEL
ncbi:MAG: phosphate/phosphite/phosphonate ABC transporter substrate-binding protein [Desulfovibrio sp.]